MKTLKKLKVTTDEINNLETNSSQVHEIIGQTPSIIITYGTTTIFIFVLSLLIVSHILKYPEVIQGEFQLTKASISFDLRKNLEGLEEIYFLNNPDLIIPVENVNLETADNIFTLANYPKEYNLGVIYLSSEKYRILKSGHEVILKFKRYPYQEFGYIKSNIIKISDSSDSWLILFILIPTDLVTQKGHLIPKEGDLSGSFEIITDHKSILKKIIPLIKIYIK